MFAEPPIPPPATARRTPGFTRPTTYANSSRARLVARDGSSTSPLATFLIIGGVLFLLGIIWRWCVVKNQLIKNQQLEEKSKKIKPENQLGNIMVTTGPTISCSGALRDPGLSGGEVAPSELPAERLDPLELPAGTPQSPAPSIESSPENSPIEHPSESQESSRALMGGSRRWEPSSEYDELSPRQQQRRSNFLSLPEWVSAGESPPRDHGSLALRLLDKVKLRS